MLNIKKYFQIIIPFIIFFFASIIILNTFIFLPIKLPWDAYYHLSRANNLYGNALQSLYPQNFHTLSQIGTVTNIFYPSINMQFIVNLIPRISNNPLFVYKSFIFLSFYITSIISYIVLHYKIKSPNIISIPLSIVWASFVFTTTQGGDSLGLMSLPFLCYGLEHLSKNKGYVFISVGIILSFYGHLITALLASLSVAIYYLMTLVKKKERYIATKNIIKVGIISLMGISCIIIPMLIISKNNTVQTPAVSIHTFKTWLLSLDLFNSPTFITIALFIGIAIAKTKIITRGQIVSLTIAILGTTAFCWPQLNSLTFLSVIQMPVRIFNFGLFLLIFFTIINLAKIAYSKQSIKVLYFSLTMPILIVMFTIHDNVSPSINSNGQEEVATSQDITTYLNSGNDGYSIMNLGAFNFKTFDNQSIWNLMNYSDYVPKSILQDSNTTMLSTDKKGKQIIQHNITTTDGTQIKTINYKATPTLISFKSSQNISSGTIKLPILGYNKTDISVYLNSKSISHSVENGQITIHDSIKSTDTLSIKQFIPRWEIISISISAVAWLVLIFNQYISKLFFISLKKLKITI